MSMQLVSIAVLVIAQIAQGAGADGHSHDHSAHGEMPNTMQDGQDWVDAAHSAGKVRQPRIRKTS